MRAIDGDSISRGRVLVVEDNQYTASFISEELSEHGYDVVGPASNIAQALLFARGAEIDAALVDLDLHGVLANDVFKILSERKIPFVFVTAHRTLPVGMRYTAPTIEKPFTYRALLTALEGILRVQSAIIPRNPAVR